MRNAAIGVQHAKGSMQCASCDVATCNEQPYNAPLRRFRAVGRMRMAQWQEHRLRHQQIERERRAAVVGALGVERLELDRIAFHEDRPEAADSIDSNSRNHGNDKT